MSPSFARRWARRILLGLLGLLALALAGGGAYEWAGRRAAARDFPPPGKLVDIGGRKIQVDCRGTGSPTVVFESGLDTYGSLSWSLVHEEIARTTRACAYSRAGIMWSDPAPGLRDGTAIAEDLHFALEAAGERPPYVLVGHSLGGSYAMIYTQRHGAEVAGLVFGDASHPDQMRRLESLLPSSRPPVGVLKAVAALSWTGLVRAAMGLQSRALSKLPGMPRPPPEAQRATMAHAPTSIDAAVAEIEALDETLAEAGALRQLGDRPLVVLTATAPLPDVLLAAQKITRDQDKERQVRWRALQDEESSWSSRGRHQMVDGASHYIQFDRPEVVIAAVRSVVESVAATKQPGILIR